MSISLPMFTSKCWESFVNLPEIFVTPSISFRTLWPHLSQVFWFIKRGKVPFLHNYINISRISGANILTFKHCVCRCLFLFSWCGLLYAPVQEQVDILWRKVMHFPCSSRVHKTTFEKRNHHIFCVLWEGGGGKACWNVLCTILLSFVTRFLSFSGLNVNSRIIIH